MGSLTRAAMPILFAAGGLGGCVGATPEPVDVEAEVGAALAAEKSAFESRDCDATLEHWSDEPFLMLVNGAVRARDKGELRTLCDQVMAQLPPGAGARPVTDERVEALSGSSALTTTLYPNSGPPGSPPATVTKVWKRTADGWRIVHLHESFNQTHTP